MEGEKFMDDNKIEVFKNAEFGDVRTVVTDGEPWLVGKDVAAALGYANASKAVIAHVDDEDKRFEMLAVSDSQNGNLVKTALINESGLYSLVLSSKLPTAKKFKRWVTSEVLPSIRKHGAYAFDELLDNPDFLIKALNELKEERAKRKALEAENLKQKQTIADFQPIKQYVDKILSSTGAMATTQIAADYDISAQKLNKILRDSGVQRKVNGQWILYAKYMGKGYTSSKTVDITRSDGTPDTKMQTVWTQKGRLLIHNILEERGIKATMDRE